MADQIHKTKIVVEGDAKSAVSAFGAVKNAVNGVSRVVSVFTRSLAIFGLAANAVQLLVEGYRKLSSWIERTAGASKELHAQRELARHEAAISSLASKYKRLNDEIKKTADLEKAVNGIVDARKSRERDLEDARLEADRQEELARLNTASPTYDAEKKAIERKYESRAADITAARSREDNDVSQSRLARERSAKSGEISKLERLLTGARGEATLARESGDDKALEEAKKKVDEFAAALADAREALAILDEQYAQGENAADVTDRIAATKKKALETEARREEGAAAQRQAEEREKAQQSAAEEAAAIRREQKQEEIDNRRNRIAALESYDAALQGVVGPSQNRLTAMGLGAGVSPVGVGLSGDVHQMLDVLKKQLAIEERQNNARGEIASLFSE